MNFKLKHIAPYLEHKVKCSYRPCSYEKRRVNAYVTNLGHEIGVETTYLRRRRDKDNINFSVGECISFAGNNSLKDLQFKLKLRPMSDLFENIVHNGGIVCVAELIRNLAPDEKQLWGINKKHQTLTNISRERFWYPVKNPLGLPYWAIEMLFKYHFDVFGLIEKGLAEPIKQQQWKG